MNLHLSIETILITVSVLIVVSILIGKAGVRYGIPTLLLFLVVGMAFGTDGLGLEFNNVGQTQFIGVIALCIILFTGGLETKVTEIRPILLPGLLLATVGVILTTAFTGGFIYMLSRWQTLPFTLPVVICFLLAATMSSTDSASVFNLLRSKNVYLKYNLKPMLELESGSNDPMAFILTILLIQIVGETVDANVAIGSWTIVGNIFLKLLQEFGIGGAFGVAIGYASIWIINRINLSNTPLYGILLLAIMFLTYSFCGLIDGNGYLAVYIAGIIIGNHKITNRKQIVSFLDSMTWMMQIAMFLLLGLLVTPHEMFSYAHIAVLIGIFVILLARPLSVFLTLAPFRKVNIRSKAFISWVGLRGAAPIIFATYPIMAKVEGAELIFNIVFFITLLSLLIQGTSITWVANLLKVTETPPYNPANTFGIEIPEEAGKLIEITLTEGSLAHGRTLSDIHLPEGMLVMIIKRGERFIVPNGKLKLRANDRLLIISNTDDESDDAIN